jgi:hypothetical protein
MLRDLLPELAHHSPPKEDSAGLRTLYNDVQQVLALGAPGIEASFMLQPRYEELKWLKSFRERQGRPLWGYICIDDFGGRVSQVNDMEGGGLKNTLMIGYLSCYPGSGSAVHYAFEEDFLYLELEEDEEDVFRKNPRNVYRWVRFTVLLEKPDDV